MATRRETLTRMVAGTSLALTGGRRSRAEAGGGPARIKIGQIGVGHGHADKLAIWRRSDDYEVVGVVEPDPAARAAAESQPAFRGLPWMTRQQLLELPGLQVVLVETAVSESLDAAEACVAAGKHIHLDKPPGSSLPRLARILDAATRQRLLVQMGYMYRYNPGFVMLRQFVRDGWLGEIFEAHAVMSKAMDPESRRQLAAYPGGTLFEYGGYLIDMIFTILGPAERIVGFTQHAAQTADTLVDNGVAVLAYPRALATIRSSAMEVLGQGRRHLVVCGTEGTFQIQPLDDPVVTLTLARPRGGRAAGTHRLTMPRYERHVADAADMARVIRGEKPTDFPAEHDLAVHRALLEACRLPLDV